jgi:deoxyribodipyrimidine photo-lyase
MDYTLFIFRRDLRIVDNVGLNYAFENCENIIPIFIFVPEQVTNNEYKSDNAIQFMIESLKDLDKNLKKYKSKLHLFYGTNEKVLKNIIEEINVKTIIFNMDYSPYAIDRDLNIEILCEKNNIEYIKTEDYLLSNIGTLNKANGEPYLVFTPFKNNGLKKVVTKPHKIKPKNLNIIKKKLKNNINFNFNFNFIKYKYNPNIYRNGGRINALKTLNKIKNQKNYNETRNIMNIESSSLSAYIKFGNISIREVYYKIKTILGSKNDLLGQLYWREFYYYIAYYFPNILRKGQNYNSKYNKIKWNNNKKNFEKWCNGETGYPIVDAGMRQLNEIGFMHNRSRLITANFLNRMLGQDWRNGEKYYASKLSDYDPAVNNGNWQWIASTGVDPKPYFQRLFNPMLQSKKFDINAEYIKKWLPELKDIPNKELHDWSSNYQKYDLKKLNYFKPIVNYKDARKQSIQMYTKK